jgi:hypothetical protein
MKKNHLFVALPIAAVAIAIAVFLAWQARRTAGPDVSQSPAETQAQGGLTGGEEEPSRAAENGVLAAGRIEVSPELLDRSKQIGVVYVMLRSAAGGPPYAVVRLENPRSGEPIPFELTAQNVMVQGVPLPADAKIIARFDADGSAGPEAPGDLVGESLVDGVDAQAVMVLVNREGGQPAQ